jgi:quercetin dioxygenase-like cupin family protein
VNFHPDLAGRAEFGADAMRKLQVVATERLLLGLNCFEPGQTQRMHEHAGADKFYLVLSGKARIVVGEEPYETQAGDLVVAPAGAPHGVAHVYQRTVMLIGMSR